MTKKDKKHKEKKEEKENKGKQFFAAFSRVLGFWARGSGFKV